MRVGEVKKCRVKDDLSPDIEDSHIGGDASDKKHEWKICMANSWHSAAAGLLLSCLKHNSSTVFIFRSCSSQSVKNFTWQGSCGLFFLDEIWCSNIHLVCWMLTSYQAVPWLQNFNIAFQRPRCMSEAVLLIVENPVYNHQPCSVPHCALTKTLVQSESIIWVRQHCAIARSSVSVLRLTSAQVCPIQAWTSRTWLGLNLGPMGANCNL